MNQFGGYVGVGLWQDQFVDGLVLPAVFLLFFFFALQYWWHVPFFLQMLREIFSVKERGNLFEDSENENRGVHVFLLFQMLFLCSLFVFFIAREKGVTVYLSGKEQLLLLALFFLVLVVYYLVKKLFYFTFAYTFYSEERYRFWKRGYDAAIAVWGIFLYLPVFLFLAKADLFATSFLFLISFISSRIVIIYKTIRIFYMKNGNLFYISLYLCAQEIIPLFLLCKGVNEMCYFIEMNI